MAARQINPGSPTRAVWRAVKSIGLPPGACHICPDCSISSKLDPPSARAPTRLARATTSTGKSDRASCAGPGLRISSSRVSSRALKRRRIAIMTMHAKSATSRVPAEILAMIDYPRSILDLNWSEDLLTAEADARQNKADRAVDANRPPSGTAKSWRFHGRDADHR